MTCSVFVINFFSDCLVGPCVCPHWLTGSDYRDFLLHDLQSYWKVYHSQSEHGGTCMRVLCAVQDALSNTYHGQWIHRGGPSAWPPRFTPDLNHLNFYLWEHLKICVYAAPVGYEETLHHLIVFACQTICNYRCVWLDVAFHDETSRGVHWILCRTFWAPIVNVLLQL
jgi:hypothetical protein